MTRFEQVLSELPNDAARDEGMAWFNSRPECIKELIHEYPPGVPFELDGKIAYIFGYAEYRDHDGNAVDPGIIFSFVNPAVDYNGAFKSRHYICGNHLLRDKK